MINERSQKRLMLAGFRLLRRDAREGRFVILFRDRDLFSEVGNDGWKVLASYTDKKDRDRSVESLMETDVWTVEI
jgi:hypothetical protein